MVVVDMEHHLAFGTIPRSEYPIISDDHDGAFGRADRGLSAGTIVPQNDNTHLEHAKNAAAAAAVAAAVAAAAVDAAAAFAAEPSTSTTHGSRSTIGSTAPSKHNEARRKALREANRIHCRETRERKRQRERLLLEVSTRH